MDTARPIGHRGDIRLDSPLTVECECCGETVPVPDPRLIYSDHNLTPATARCDVCRNACIPDMLAPHDPATDGPIKVNYRGGHYDKWHVAEFPGTHDAWRDACQWARSYVNESHPTAEAHVYEPGAGVPSRSFGDPRPEPTTD